MKGFVATPAPTVDIMVAKLFDGLPPTGGNALLDPGCGEGEFIDGVLRTCRLAGWPLPRIVGVELDPGRARTARERFGGIPEVTIREADFLESSGERFDYIIGNPPYVSILGLSAEERRGYKTRYASAVGRFDLYSLFFEQAVRMLTPGGRLVFITPEKYLYVETARPLRGILRAQDVEELHFVGEDTFPGRVTYPLITAMRRGPSSGMTRIVLRDGGTSSVPIANDDSWLPMIAGFSSTDGPAPLTLADVCVRISAGVATGADGVFVRPTDLVSPELLPFSHPTISGRQITPSGETLLQSSLLAPYDADGRLLPEHQLGALGEFLGDPVRRRQLTERTCAERKPWYAFHDNLPLADLLRPKLLCKDITEAPFFVTDPTGQLVPRHTVYYVVPADPEDLEPLATYLNSEPARAWLQAHCQRAANGFLRMQSHVLKRLPVPGHLAGRRRSFRDSASQTELLRA